MRFLYKTIKVVSNMPMLEKDPVMPWISPMLVVKDVDEQFKKAQQVGLSVISEPEDMFWGDRVTRMQDADGHTWSVATRVADYQQLHSATA